MDTARGRGETVQTVNTDFDFESSAKYRHDRQTRKTIITTVDRRTTTKRVKKLIAIDRHVWCPLMSRSSLVYAYWCQWKMLVICPPLQNPVKYPKTKTYGLHIKRASSATESPIRSAFTRQLDFVVN